MVILVLFFFSYLIDFIFKAVLCSHKIERKVQWYPLYLFPPHTCTASPIFNIPHRSGPFVPIDELTLTNHYRPKPTVYIRFTLDAVHSTGLDKFITTQTHHYSIAQNSFPALKFSVFPQFIHPFSLPAPDDHSSFDIDILFYAVGVTESLRERM